MTIKEIAYKNGLVRELKDVPKEESLSEEEVKYYLNEESSVYNFPYKEGDIVFVSKYYYPSGEEGTNHLFVIIENNYAVSMEYFCFLISSQLQKLSYKENLYLPKSDKNKLRKDSIIKTDIIYRIEEKEINRKIGEVTKEELDNYKKIFIEIYSK